MYVPYLGPSNVQSGYGARDVVLEAITAVSFATAA
jgi:hypothetical protein